MHALFGRKLLQIRVEYFLDEYTYDNLNPFGRLVVFLLFLLYFAGHSCSVPWRHLSFKIWQGMEGFWFWIGTASSWVGLGCGLVVCNQSISRKRVTQYVYSCIFYYNIFLPYPGIFVFVVFLRLCSCEAVITRGHCCTQLYSAVLRWLCCFNFHEEIKTKSVLSVQSTCFPFNITYFAFYFNTCFC